MDSMDRVHLPRNTMNLQCFGDVGGSRWHIGRNWAPRKNQYLSTNTRKCKGFCDAARDGSRNFSESRGVALTQNSMDFHVLAHVGLEPTWLQHAPGIRPMTRNRMNYKCLVAVAHERRTICFAMPCGTRRKHNEFKGFWRCWWIPVACWSHVGTPNGTANMRQHVRIQTFSAMRWKSGVAFLVRRIGCPQRETA